MRGEDWHPITHSKSFECIELDMMSGRVRAKLKTDLEWITSDHKMTVLTVAPALVLGKRMILARELTLKDDPLEYSLIYNKYGELLLESY